MAGTCDFFPWLPWCSDNPGVDTSNPAQVRTRNPDKPSTPSDVDKRTMPLSHFLSMLGWQGDDLRTMTAVVLAEGRSEINSKGDIKCRANFAGCCWGPFQLNLKAHNLDKSVACDWQKAGAFAYKLYQADKKAGRSGFTDWSAYTNRSYKLQLGKDIQIHAVSSPMDTVADGLDSVTPLHDVGSAIQGLTGLLGNLFDPSFWLRSGKVILGGLLLLAGLIALMMQTSVGKTAVKTAVAVK